VTCSLLGVYDLIEKTCRRPATLLASWNFFSPADRAVASLANRPHSGRRGRR
jgi:hypothetical protein